MKTVQYCPKNVGLPRFRIEIYHFVYICKHPYVTRCSSNSRLGFVNMDHWPSNNSLQKSPHCFIVILGDSRLEVPAAPCRDGKIEEALEYPGDASLRNAN